MAIAKIMCFGNGNKEDPDTKKSKEIEKQLREDQRRMQKEVKLLLLGKDTYKTRITLTEAQWPWLTPCRCRRVGQIDSTEADATDPHQGIPTARAETMEGHHLPEPAACLPGRLRCHGRAGGRLRRQ